MNASIKSVYIPEKHKSFWDQIGFDLYELVFMGQVKAAYNVKFAKYEQQQANSSG